MLRAARPALLLAALLLIAATPALAQKRLALVIGNGAYQHATPLSNPANDAIDIAAALEATGFTVITGVDLDKRAFDLKLRDMARALAGAEVALFYYAGHGLQVAGQNYLVPVDARLETERDLEFESVRLDFVLRQMEIDRDGKTSLVFLDACRDNPLARNLARSMGTRSAAIGKGLAQVQAGVGTFVAYSTQPGNVALDGQGRNSPFTAALAKRVLERDRHLTAIMIDVRRDVLAASSGRQVPWDHSALTGEFFFSRSGPDDGLPKEARTGIEDAAALQERVRRLEQELKTKSDPSHTAKVVELAQLKERVRQADEAIKADRNRIFDMQRMPARGADAQERANQSFEIGKIHIQIARRGQELKELRERIATLEKELGLSAPTAAK